MIGCVIAAEKDLSADFTVRLARPIFEAPAFRQHQLVRAVLRGAPRIGKLVVLQQQAERHHIFDDGLDEILHASSPP